jgi:hypothetical protein
MKKIISTLLAIFISGSAAAEWTRIGGGTDNSEIYVDLETVRRNGDKVKLWTMQSFETLNNELNSKHLSTKSHRELDCKAEQSRTPAYLQFSGQKGTGTPLISIYEPNDVWKPVTPGTVGQMIFDAGCDITIGTHKWSLMKTEEPDADNMTMRTYIDRSKIQRKGNIASVWVLFDLKGVDYDPQGKSYSLKFRVENDCTGLQVREISRTYYAANMAVGKSDPVSLIPQWMPIEKESTAYDVWKTICAS